MLSVSIDDNGTTHITKRDTNNELIFDVSFDEDEMESINTTRMSWLTNKIFGPSGPVPHANQTTMDTRLNYKRDPETQAAFEIWQAQMQPPPEPTAQEEATLVHDRYQELYLNGNHLTATSQTALAVAQLESTVRALSRRVQALESERPLTMGGVGPESV